MKSLYNTLYYFTSDVESVSMATDNNDKDNPLPSSPPTSSEQDWIPKKWIQKGMDTLKYY